jgi:tyrosine-protein phosphatase SIW14
MMSDTNGDTTTPAGQAHTTVEGVFERVREYVHSLGLYASDGLLQHVAENTHEDLKVVVDVSSHECTVTCTAASCGTITPAASIRSAAPEHLQSLVPPFNFGSVLHGAIYRSSYPKEENYDFLKDLGLKTILTLVPEPLSPEYEGFMKDAGIQHFHVHIRANKGEIRVESCQMSRALRLIMDPSNHPMLVHCNKGKHRTGCTIACFRRILGNDSEAVLEEYHSYAGKKSRAFDELFFENFNLNSVMWMARQEGWAAPEIGVGLPTPPASLSSSAGTTTLALA